jgi:hypothetical protein
VSNSARLRNKGLLRDELDLLALGSKALFPGAYYIRNPP